MILHKLHTGRKVCLVELVRDVPAERPELTPLLTEHETETKNKKVADFLLSRKPLISVNFCESILNKHKIYVNILW